MPNRIDFARPPSCSLLTAVALITLTGWSGEASAQGAGGQEERPTRSTRNILGGVPMSAADSARQEIVARLDFDSFKDLVRGLTEFGDREQGTPRNAAAVDWIEAQFRGWGYETERVHYMFTPRESDTPEPREQVFATKWGSDVPGEMYIISGHMDGRGGGEAANDDASGTALVMEIARALSGPEIETARTIRFALWNNEETGLNGSRAYVEQRAELQGIEDPAGSGRYPEPKWLGMIQHDMMLWDHGNPVTFNQALDADVDIEFQLNSAMAAEWASQSPEHLHGGRRRSRVGMGAIRGEDHEEHSTHGDRRDHGDPHPAQAHHGEIP